MEHECPRGRLGAHIKLFRLSAISADGSWLTTRACKRRPFDFVGKSPCQYWESGCKGVSLLPDEASKSVFRNPAVGRPQESASLAESRKTNVRPVRLNCAGCPEPKTPESKGFPCTIRHKLLNGVGWHWRGVRGIQGETFASKVPRSTLRRPFNSSPVEQRNGVASQQADASVVRLRQAGLLYFVEERFYRVVLPGRLTAGVVPALITVAQRPAARTTMRMRFVAWLAELESQQHAKQLLRSSARS